MFIETLLDMAARHERVLIRLTEIGLSAAEAVHERVLAAETPDEAAAMSLALHRISRSVRQTLALEARLMRERQCDAREAQVLAAQARDRERTIRRAQVRGPVERLIWHEIEGDDEALELIGELDERLAEAVLHDGFLETPIEALIARVCDDLGLPPEMIARLHGEARDLGPSEAADAPWPPDTAWPSGGDFAAPPPPNSS